MHVRLQTWFPFSIQVCLNGREWLERRMQRAGLAFHKQDNCFSWIERVEEAQTMLASPTTRKWVRRLQAWARRANPWLQTAQGRTLPAPGRVRHRREIPGIPAPWRRSILLCYATPSSSSTARTCCAFWAIPIPAAFGASQHPPGPPFGGRAGQTPGRRKLFEDVRQARPRPARGDHHQQPPASVRLPAPPPARTGAQRLAAAAQRHGRSALPSPSGPRRQRQLPQRPQRDGRAVRRTACWTPFPTRSGCAAAAIGRCAPSAHVTAAWNPPPNADASTQRRISAQIGRFLRLCRAHGLLRKVHGTATASLTRATCS